MRVLFSFVGGRGHAEPMVPVAAALRAAGHTVAFAGHAGALPGLAFETVVTDGSPDDPPPERLPLAEPDQAHEEEVVRTYFADRGPRRRLPRYRELYADWRPDLVVRDEMDLGAALATEAAGLPHAVVLVIAAGGFVRPDTVEAPLTALRAELGLPPVPAVAALWRGLVLSPFPPALRDPAHPVPAPVHAFRTVTPAPPRRTGRPLIYLTLGTVFPVESGDLFGRLLAGLALLPVDVVVTVGPDLDPAELGPQPPHVRVERWLDLPGLLPAVDLVVSHGGSGTVTAALAHGLPQVVVALGADQLLTAARVEALGIGRTLHPVTVTPAEVADTVAAVLADPAARAAAARLAAEYAGLPGPESAVPRLVALAAAPR